MTIKRYDTVLTMVPFFPKGHPDNRITQEVAANAYATEQGKYRPCVILGQDKKDKDILLAQIRTDLNDTWPPRTIIKDWDELHAKLLHQSAILTSALDIVRVPIERADQLHHLGHLSDNDIKTYESAFYKENSKYHAPQNHKQHAVTKQEHKDVQLDL